jgi:hypothetical protein
MNEAKIVFDPFAAHAERDYVEEILSRRNVRLTSHDDWYPVNFFVKTGEGEILGGLLGYIWARWLPSVFSRSKSHFAARVTAPS